MDYCVWASECVFVDSQVGAGRVGVNYNTILDLVHLAVNIHLVSLDNTHWRHIQNKNTKFIIKITLYNKVCIATGLHL